MLPYIALVSGDFSRMRFRSCLAVVGVALLGGCGGSDGSSTAVRSVAKVTVVGSSTTLNVGQTTQLTATATDASGATITNPGVVLWTSSATTVATVDQTGKVTAVGAGTATVTADAAGVKGTLNIKVNLVGGA